MPAPLVPDSHFRDLRDNDNVFQLDNGRTVKFASDQVKISSSQPGFLIGTDGNDQFGARATTLEHALNAKAGTLTNFLGGGGNDMIGGGQGDDTIWGGTGDDVLIGREGNDRLYGEEGDDQLLGGDGNDLLNGGAGADKLFGSLGDDQMWGGDGDDYMKGCDIATDTKLGPGQSDDDLMFGEAGNDIMSGGCGNDQLWGGIGDDSLYGDDGDDKLYGEAGNDNLCGGIGNDVIFGGDGDDVIYGDIKPFYSALSGTVGGNDLLYGGAGNDSLSGGAGDDMLDGGSGNDSMDGGRGDDTYVVDCVGDSVNELADQGHDTVIAACSFTLGQNVEDLLLAEGGQFNGTGNGLDNLITGNGQDNILTGNRGANVIKGAQGNDTLIGQAGNDTYVFARGDGRDVIVDQDATRGNVDVLQLSDLRQTNLWFSQAGNDLQIDVLGGSDRITVKDWYVGGTSGSDNHIERIRTADGNTLYDSDVEQLVHAMASFAPPSALQTDWTPGQSSQGKVLLTITH